MASAEYATTYFHIADLIPESNGVMSRADYEAYFKELGTLKAKYVRYIKSNLGKKSAFLKLQKLLHTTEFINIAQASDSVCWSEVPIVSL